MNVIKSKINLSLGDELMVTSVKSGNLLLASRHEAGANPTDSVSDLKALKFDMSGVLSDAIVGESRPIDAATFGMGMYNRLTEVKTTESIYLDPSETQELPADYSLAQIFWSTENGDYQIRPASIAKGKDWYVQFELTRVSAALKVEEEELVDWASMSRADRMDFVLRKFSELIAQQPLTKEEAMKLATHKHYKGGLYRVLGPIRNADDGEAADRTLYMHLFPHENSLWHRDTEEFNGFLNTGEQRFAPIEDKLPLILNDDGQSMEVTAVLRVVDTQPNTNGIVFMEPDVSKFVAKLNERVGKELVVGEFQPNLTEDDQRFGSVSQQNACCRFMSFAVRDVTTEKGKRVKAVVARVQPYGPRAMDYMENLRTAPMAGFAMRAYCDTVVEDDVQYLAPREIISFDYVAERS